MWTNIPYDECLYDWYETFDLPTNLKEKVNHK